MKKKWMLLGMFVVNCGLAFITLSSILSGCSGQVPLPTTYDQTSTFTSTPSPTRTPTSTPTP